MRQPITRLCLALIASLILALHALAAPPRVVSTTPEYGDRSVAPDTRTIEVVFDQPMNANGYSIVGGGPSFPEITRRPRWSSDGTTLQIPVKLLPDHAYNLSFNSHTHKNFQSRSGEAATPYPLRFQTGRAQTNPRDSRSAANELQINKEAIEELTRAMTLHYAHFEKTNINWAQRVRSMAPTLELQNNPRSFAMIVAELLRDAQDKHLFLQLDNGEHVPTYSNPVTPNIDPDWIRTAALEYKQPLPHLAFATLQNNIPYARVDTWSASDPYAFEPLFAFLGKNIDAPAIIIDVRLNGGGSETVAQHFASCFYDEPAVYATNVYRDNGLPGGFTEPHKRALQPNLGRPRYKGHVVVLTGPVVMSSCEAFVLMMRQAPRATIIGQTTQGSSGNPQPYPLGNGVTLYVPSWKSMTPEGKEFEGVGLEPDIHIPWETPSLLTPDPLIEAALEHINNLPGSLAKP